MENDTITVTKRVVQLGGSGMGVSIPKDVIDALQIVQGHLVEVSIRNTGIMTKEDSRRKKAEHTMEPITN